MTVARHYLSTVSVAALAVGMGALRVIVFGNAYGATAETDAYFNAYLWFRMFFEDVPSLLLPMLIPAYLAQLNTGNVQQSQQLLRHWVWSRGAQFLGLLVALAVLSPWILRWTTAGLPEGAYSLASQMLWVVLLTAPVLFFACLLRVHLESRHRFVASGIFRLVLLSVSTVMMALSPWLGIWAAVWGLTAGALAGLVCLLIAYYRDVRRLTRDENLATDSAAPEIGITADGTQWSLLWILASVLLQRASTTIDLHFGAAIEPGAVTLFNQIGTLISLPVMILVQSLSTVLVPRAAQLQAAGQWLQLRQGLWRMCAAVCGASLVAVVLLQFLAEPLIRVLFFRTVFDEHQIADMVTLLRLYALSILPLSLHLACLGLTASHGAVRVLTALSFAAIVVRYGVLAGQVDTLTLEDLVYAHMAYHGTWVIGLLGYLTLRVRGEVNDCDPASPALSDCSGVRS
ncbi:MAG: oligosaccharide flippase family protein [Planctomycetaceae bacterium]|nr:oligosaccharide flippase family protein [Planctomycetaceae bacterium]